MVKKKITPRELKEHQEGLQDIDKLSKNSASSIRWAKDAVNKLHELHPDYVFLTDTGATPFGYVLKEAWRKAYSNEPLPKFYLIEPSNYGGSPSSEHYIRGINARIKKENARIVIFDEGNNDNPGVTNVYRYDSKKSGLISDAMNHSSNLFEQINNSTLGKVTKEVRGALTLASKKSELFGMRGGEFDILGNNDNEGSSSKPTTRTNKYSETQDSRDYQGLFKGGSKLPKKDGRWGARIVKHPLQRARALEYIKVLKQIGKEAGTELHTELKKQKSLEQRVSGTASVILGIFGIFFLISNFSSSNIQLSPGATSFNWRLWSGIVLLIVGLVFGIIYFRKRK